jgi:hypothetical protein
MFIISFTEFFAVHPGGVGATYLYFPSATIEFAGISVQNACRLLPPAGLGAAAGRRGEL